MTTYRRYRAAFPFNAREDQPSELSMQAGETLLVGQSASGQWPNPEKWMHGFNESTKCEGEFPGGQYVQFVEEFTVQPDPPPEPPKKPVLPPLPEKQPTLPRHHGGIQVFPTGGLSNHSSTSTSNITSPSHAHQPIPHSISHGSMHMPTTTVANDEEAPPPPPRRGSNKPVQNHSSSSLSESHPPKPVPRNRKRSSTSAKANEVIPESNASGSLRPAGAGVESGDNHEWSSVVFGVPMACSACEFARVCEYVSLIVILFCNPSPWKLVFQPLILRHQRVVIRGHYIIRHDGLLSLQNLVCSKATYAYAVAIQHSSNGVN